MAKNEAKDIIPGLEYVRKHNMTDREIDIYLMLLKKDMTATDIATALGIGTSATHNMVMRMRLKNLVVMKDKAPGTGMLIYAVA